MRKNVDNSKIEHTTLPAYVFCLVSGTVLSCIGIWSIISGTAVFPGGPRRLGVASGVYETVIAEQNNDALMFWIVVIAYFLLGTLFILIGNYTYWSTRSDFVRKIGEVTGFKNWFGPV